MSAWLWNTCVGFILWLWGLANVPDVARGNYLFFLKPVIAALLAFFIIGQPITWVQVLAILVVCSSVLLEMSWPWLARRRAAARDA